MNHIEERKFSQSLDKSFRITRFLQSFRLLNSFANFLINLLCKASRKFYSASKKKSGNLIIISIHRLGDTVFTIPAINLIYNHYKSYKKFIICFSEAKDILALKFDENELVAINKQDFFFGRRLAKSKVRKIIRSLNPEIIFDLTGQVSSASMIFNSKAQTIIGTNKSHLKDLYDKFTDYRTTPAFMDIYLDVVRLVMPIKNLDEVKTFSQDQNKFDKIIIHPFAIRKAKEWSLKRYIELAADLNKDYEVEIISPPGFIPENIIKEISRCNISFEETKSIKHLIQKIKGCSLFISNDSGPTYIASLLGKATFTIYGPTNPAYSLPIGNNHRYALKKLKCSASLNERFCFTEGGVYCPSNECMVTLSFTDVKKEILQFITDLGIKKKVYESLV